MVLGEMEANRVSPYQSGRVETPAYLAWFAPHRWSPDSGVDSRSASYPGDDVHQARMTEGVGGWRMTCGEDRRGTGGCVRVRSEGLWPPQTTSGVSRARASMLELRAEPDAP